MEIMGAITKPLMMSLLISAIGIKIIYDGVTGDVPKIFTTLGLSSSILVVGGVVLQIPVILFIYAGVNG